MPLYTLFVLVVLPVGLAVLLARKVHESLGDYWKYAGLLFSGLLVFGLVAARVPPPRRPMPATEMLASVVMTFLGPFLVAALVARVVSAATKKPIPIAVAAAVTYVGTLMALVAIAISTGVVRP